MPALGADGHTSQAGSDDVKDDLGRALDRQAVRQVIASAALENPAVPNVIGRLGDVHSTLESLVETVLSDPDRIAALHRTGLLDGPPQLALDRFAALTADEATGALEDAAIAYATVNSMHDVWAHPQLAARERWHQVGTPAGPVPALAPPGHGSTGPRMDPVPAVGEHTRRIVSALGYSPEEIDSLEADGVV
jgi:hypothetical protein